MSVPTSTSTPATQPALRKKRQKSEAASRRHGIAPWLVLGAVMFTVLAWLFPLWMAVVNAFKTPQDFLDNGSLSLPNTLDFTSITKFWTDVDFNRKLFNSIQVSFWVALIGVTLSFLTAYAIGIGRIKGRAVVLGLFMVAFTIPQEALIYPLYKMSKTLGLYDSVWSVIIIFSVLQSAFGTYMLSSVLSEFPSEILEAAEIDGAGSFRIMWNVVLPIVRPTMMVLATFFFIWTWNEFLIPLVLLPTNDHQTVALSMAITTGQYTSDPTTRAAAALVGMLPSLAFFLVFQRTLMRGVTLGAVK
jgi:raffinose/stachyose/melibiose transport system permease protein